MHSTESMSNIEKIQLMEQLWQELSYESPEIESPSWHQDILDERSELIRNGKAEWISLEKARELLDIEDA